jgi:hypothetical protein
MEIEMATITKLDNGYVVALQWFSELKGQKDGTQLIAKDLDEAVGFLKSGGKSTPTLAVQGIFKT